MIETTHPKTLILTEVSATEIHPFGIEASLDSARQYARAMEHAAREEGSRADKWRALCWLSWVFVFTLLLVVLQLNGCIGQPRPY
jgi:hypothetical protein